MKESGEAERKESAHTLVYIKQMSEEKLMRIVMQKMQKETEVWKIQYEQGLNAQERWFGTSKQIVSQIATTTVTYTHPDVCTWPSVCS